jgi:hypothetical protein
MAAGTRCCPGSGGTAVRLSLAEQHGVIVLGLPTGAPTRSLKVAVTNVWVVQVQVQVCFTSVCGQVQPLDVALNNSV